MYAKDRRLSQTSLATVSTSATPLVCTLDHSAGMYRRCRLTVLKDAAPGNRASSEKRPKSLEDASLWSKIRNIVCVRPVKYVRLSSLTRAQDDLSCHA